MNLHLLTAIYLAGLGLAVSLVFAGYLFLKPGPSRGLFFVFCVFALAWPLTLCLVLWTLLVDLASSLASSGRRRS